MGHMMARCPALEVELKYDKARSALEAALARIDVYVNQVGKIPGLHFSTFLFSSFLQIILSDHHLMFQVLHCIC